MGQTFQHAICVVKDLRGLLGSYDLPILFSLALSFFSLFSMLVPLLSLFLSLEAIHCGGIDLSSYCMVDITTQLYVCCNICSVKVILNMLVFSDCHKPSCLSWILSSHLTCCTSTGRMGHCVCS